MFQLESEHSCLSRKSKTALRVNLEKEAEANLKKTLTASEQVKQNFHITIYSEEQTEYRLMPFENKGTIFPCFTHIY